MNCHPYGFPFRRLEYGLAVDVGTASTQAAHEQSTPRHNHIQGDRRQNPVDVLETSVFDATARFQRAEKTSIVHRTQ